MCVHDVVVVSVYVAVVVAIAGGVQFNAPLLLRAHPQFNSTSKLS